MTKPSAITFAKPPSPDGAPSPLPCPASGEADHGTIPNIRLIEIAALKAHEETIPERLRRIKSELREAGEIRMPLWVEKDHLVVLNGHHRLAALKELGCRWAPAILLDYFSDAVHVTVCPGAQILSIDKQSVLLAALSGRLFPPRSSLHVLRAYPPVASTPLAALKAQGHLNHAG